MAGGSFAPRQGSVTRPELNDLRGVNAIPAHIWRSAPDGAVQFVNQQWMDYTGLSQEAGNDPKVAGLVYIAAFAPDKGESVTALIKNPPPGAPVPPILPPQDG